MQIRIIAKNHAAVYLLSPLFTYSFFHLSPFISISCVFKHLLPLSCTSAEVTNSAAKAKSKTQQQKCLRRCVDFKHFSQTKQYVFSFTRTLWLTACVALASFFITSSSIFMVFQAHRSSVMVNLVWFLFCNIVAFGFNGCSWGTVCSSAEDWN